MRLIVILFYFVLYFLVFVIPITLLMLDYVLIEKKNFLALTPVTLLMLLLLDYVLIEKNVFWH